MVMDFDKMFTIMPIIMAIIGLSIIGFLVWVAIKLLAFWGVI